MTRNPLIQPTESQVPATKSLTTLASAAKHCQGCELYQAATQTVFGEGLKSVRVILVGEAPGDREDKQGQPFVGPAGLVLRSVMADAGLDEKDVYFTNAVKHFRWEAKGQRRIHQKPLGRHIKACHPWLEAEVAAIEPELIVCLGATATEAVFGRTMTIKSCRGKVQESPLCAQTLVTVHPSSLLRNPDPSSAEEARKLFTAELAMVAEWMRHGRWNRDLATFRDVELFAEH